MRLFIFILGVAALAAADTAVNIDTTFLPPNKEATIFDSLVNTEAAEIPLVDVAPVSRQVGGHYGGHHPGGSHHIKPIPQHQAAVVHHVPVVSQQHQSHHVPRHVPIVPDTTHFHNLIHQHVPQVVPPIVLMSQVPAASHHGVLNRRPHKRHAVHQPGFGGSFAGASASASAQSSSIGIVPSNFGGHGNQGLGHGNQGLGHGNQGLGHGNQGFGHGNQGYGYGNQGFGHGNQGFDHGNQGFGHGSQGFGHGSQGFGHGSQGFGHGSQGFGHGHQGYGQGFHDIAQGIGYGIQGIGHGIQGIGHGLKGLGAASAEVHASAGATAGGFFNDH